MLASTVEAMYRIAYPDMQDCSIDCASAFTDWCRNASRNPRRLVRTILDACDRARPLGVAVPEADVAP